MRIVSSQYLSFFQISLPQDDFYESGVASYARNGSVFTGQKMLSRTFQAAGVLLWPALSPRSGTSAAASPTCFVEFTPSVQSARYRGWSSASAFCLIAPITGGKAHGM